MNECAFVEWWWQGKTNVHGEKPVLLPLYPPQIPHACRGFRPGPAQWEASHYPPKASNNPSFGDGLYNAAFKAVVLNFV